jgi:branched-chain amino acid transport system substrate-binding protein
MIEIMKTKILGIAVIAATLAAGSVSVRAETGVTENEISIGMFNPLSGPLAAFGVDPLNAARLWYDEINKKGGIHGRKLKITVEDDKCSPMDVVAVVKKLVTVDKVFMVHGGACTAATVAAQEYILREKVPFVMINAAGDSAVIPPTRYVFGAFGGTQRAVGATIVEFAVTSLKAKRIAYIAHDDDFGNSNWTTANATAKRLGAEVVVVERVPPRISDVTAPLLKIRAAKPDVIISTAYPAPAVLIAQKYAEFGMTEIPLVQAVQGVPVPALFAKNVGNNAALANFYYGIGNNELPDGPRQQKWIQLYKQYYPDRTPGAFMVNGIPSAMAVTRALEMVGRDLTREKFIEALEKLDFDTEILAGPIAFSKNRRDGHRAAKYVKFDGKTHTLMPGTFFWNGKDGM